MQLVEIVVALDTSEATLEAAREFAERPRQEAAGDQGPLGLHRQHAARPLLDGGGADVRRGLSRRARRSDEGMKLGCGHPMGPLALCDFIGLDVHLRDRRLALRGVQRAEYAPPPLLKRMVASGRIGRKASHGFYDYAPARAKATAWSAGLARASTKSPRTWSTSAKRSARSSASGSGRGPRRSTRTGHLSSRRHPRALRPSTTSWRCPSPRSTAAPGQAR